MATDETGRVTDEDIFVRMHRTLVSNGFEWELCRAVMLAAEYASTAATWDEVYQAIGALGMRELITARNS